MERGSIYPSWRYHKSLGSVLCTGPEHDKELGDEWSDEDIREFGAPADPVESVEAVEEPKKRGRKPKA